MFIDEKTARKLLKEGDVTSSNCEDIKALETRLLNSLVGTNAKSSRFNKSPIRKGSIVLQKGTGVVVCLEYVGGHEQKIVFNLRNFEKLFFEYFEGIREEQVFYKLLKSTARVFEKAV